MKHHPITVAKKDHTTDGVYIGRGSPLGNPWPMDREVDRNTVCDKYEKHIATMIAAQNPEIINELNRLAYMAVDAPLKLVCFCAPKRCHGDTIKRILEEGLAQDEELPTDRQATKS